MSVCIAAISHRGPGNRHEIIAIVDRKVSSTEFSNEDATTKKRLASKLLDGHVCWRGYIFGCANNEASKGDDAR